MGYGLRAKSLLESTFEFGVFGAKFVVGVFEGEVRGLEVGDLSVEARLQIALFSREFSIAVTFRLKKKKSFQTSVYLQVYLHHIPTSGLARICTWEGKERITSDNKCRALNFG